MPVYVTGPFHITWPTGVTEEFMDKDHAMGGPRVGPAPKICSAAAGGCVSTTTVVQACHACL